MTEELRLLLIVLAALVTALLLSFGSTPLVRKFAFRIGAIDDPNRDGRRMHKVPIPRIGGLAIFFGFIVSVMIFANIDHQLRGILLGTVVIVVLGLIDDISPLPALLKFVVQIGAALIPVLSGVRIEVFTNPNFFSSSAYLELGRWAVPITVFWIVAITNSVNFIDGLDGLAVGVSSIATFSMLVIAMMLMMPNIAVVAAALAGACVGFMPYNLNPAKIFMGDVGATSIGFILACLSVQGLFKFYALISFAVPFMILALPIFDEVFAIVRRLLKGQSPMAPDRGHVHHRLIDMGFNQKQAVAIMYTMSGILGVAAVVLTASGEMRAIIVLVAAIIIAGLFIRLFLVPAMKRREEEQAARSGEAGASPAGEGETPDPEKTNIQETDTADTPEETGPEEP